MLTLGRSLVRREDAFLEGDVGGVDALACFVGFKPGDGSCDALLEGNGGDEFRDETFDLGVVEDGGVGLVAEKRAALGGFYLHDEIAGDMDHLGFDPPAGAGVGHGGVDLVPCERFIGGNVNGLADGLVAAEDSDEGFGEIFGVSDGPECGAIAVDDEGEAAFHAIDKGVVGPGAQGGGNNGLIGV